MQFIVRDISCPICHSDHTRSKVEDALGWWYICDDWEARHEVEFLGQVTDLNPKSDEKPIGRRFYFQPDHNLIEVQGFEGAYRYKVHTKPGRLKIKKAFRIGGKNGKG